MLVEARQGQPSRNHQESPDAGRLNPLGSLDELELANNPNWRLSVIVGSLLL